MEKKYYKSLIHLLQRVYKQGILDAIDSNDLFKCKEFVEEMRQTSTFGFLNTPKMDWREWRFHLIRLGMDTPFGPSCTQYLSLAMQYTGYPAVILPIAMDFYIEGIKDFCSYPNAAALVEFEKKKFPKWGKPKRMRRARTLIDIVLEAQAYCFERANMDKHPNGGTKHNGLTRSAYLNFSNDIWRNMIDVSKL